MKDKTLFISSVLVAFLFGILSTYLFMSKQQIDRVMQTKQHIPINTNNQDGSNQANNTLVALESCANNTDAGALPAVPNTKVPSSSINDYSQQQALNIVNDMPDYILGQYVDKFMTKGSSDVISDKRRFAQRAVEELYESNDNQPLVGNVKLSLSPVMPSNSLDTSTLNKDTKLFVHLDTDGKVPTSPFVFVKWVNNQTGQVLLFEKKNIVANSNQNWVSFKPYDGWTPGSYDIRFYQFTSELQPVAQLTYNIYEVIE
ncbi:hypothetical protein [Psychrobacter sp. DAB_AL43B]|uniref:hypothetical protein n=1 Tax=Psychrobacter sp. DAB_AL43B TaxID=1028416 RepID=UPI0009A60A56|nr:hypothetical protein [Psychrobacter sp. DAB_AL43B]SLJ84887.1 hypothetical protein DABAL43B_1692 [Psychrobacter sp. DAB_AL43B]